MKPGRAAQIVWPDCRRQVCARSAPLQTVTWQPVGRSISVVWWQSERSRFLSTSNMHGTGDSCAASLRVTSARGVIFLHADRRARAALVTGVGSSCGREVALPLYEHSVASIPPHAFLRALVRAIFTHRHAGLGRARHVGRRHLPALHRHGGLGLLAVCLHHSAVHVVLLREGGQCVWSPGQSSDSKRVRSSSGGHRHESKLARMPRTSGCTRSFLAW